MGGFRTCIYVDKELWENFKAKVGERNVSKVIRGLIQGYLATNETTSIPLSSFISFIEDVVLEEDVFSFNDQVLYKLIMYFPDIATSIVVASRLKDLFIISSPVIHRAKDYILKIEEDDEDRIVVGYYYPEENTLYIEYMFYPQGRIREPPYINMYTIIRLVGNACRCRYLDIVDSFNALFSYTPLPSRKSNGPIHLPTFSLNDKPSVEKFLRKLESLNEIPGYVWELVSGKLVRRKHVCTCNRDELAKLVSFLRGVYSA